MRPKVSSTLGFSSASIAESDTEFSISNFFVEIIVGLRLGGLRRVRPADCAARSKVARSDTLGLTGAIASCAPGAVMSIFGALFLPSGPGVGRLKIDDVAQQNLAVLQVRRAR